MFARYAQRLIKCHFAPTISATMKRVLDYIVYALSAGIMRLLALLPRRCGLALATGLAKGFYWLSPWHRNIVFANLLVAMPTISQAKAKHIAMETFGNIARVGVELSRLPLLINKSPTDFAEIFSMSEEVIGTIRRLHARGKGLLYLTGHFGVWELLPNVYATYVKDIPLSVVVRPLDNPWLDKLVERYRSCLGNQMIPKKNSLRQIMEALAAGGAVGILLDQNVCRQEGVFVDFFGKMACTNFGLAALALRTESPVLPIGLFYDEAARVHRIEMEPEIMLTRTGNKAEDLRANTATFTKALETMIRKHPDQWLWVHRRWKTRPTDNDAKVY